MSHSSSHYHHFTDFNSQIHKIFKNSIVSWVYGKCKGGEFCCWKFNIENNAFTSDFWINQSNIKFRYWRLDGGRRMGVIQSLLFQGYIDRKDQAWPFGRMKIGKIGKIGPRPLCHCSIGTVQDQYSVYSKQYRYSTGPVYSI